jgi:hypothetical protein
MEDGTEYDVSLIYYDDHGTPLAFNAATPGLPLMDAATKKKFEDLVKTTIQAHAHKAQKALSDLKVMQIDNKGISFNQQATQAYGHEVLLSEAEKRLFNDSGATYTKVNDLWQHTAQILIQNYYHAANASFVEIPGLGSNNTPLEHPAAQIDVILNRDTPVSPPPRAREHPATTPSPATTPPPEDDEDEAIPGVSPFTTAPNAACDWAQLPAKLQALKESLFTTVSPGKKRKKRAIMATPTTMPASIQDIFNIIFDKYSDDIHFAMGVLDFQYKQLMTDIDTEARAKGITNQRAINSVKVDIQRALKAKLLQKLIELYHENKITGNGEKIRERQEICHAILDAQTEADHFLYLPSEQSTPASLGASLGCTIATPAASAPRRTDVPASLTEESFIDSFFKTTETGRLFWKSTATQLQTSTTLQARVKATGDKLLRESGSDYKKFIKGLQTQYTTLVNRIEQEANAKKANNKDRVLPDVKEAVKEAFRSYFIAVIQEEDTPLAALANTAKILLREYILGVQGDREHFIHKQSSLLTKQSLNGYLGIS